MHSVTKRVEDAAAVAKEKAEIFKAKTAEKAEKAVARTKEEKMIAEERRKAKEYEAKMKLHETKAEIIEDKLMHHHHGHHGHPHNPLIGTASSAVNPTSTYPLGGHHLPGHNTHHL